MKGTMQDVPVDSEWETRPLGEVIDIFDSQRVPLNSGERHERQGPYPYYGAQGVIDHVDDFLFNGRYILVAEDGENLNSKKLPLALIAQGKFWVNNHAHIIRGKEGVVDDIFLHACLNWVDIKPFITGAAQPKLSQGNLRLIEIPVPDLPTQRRIAGILSAYDELIANNQRRIAALEQMARALYREWFVYFRAPGVVMEEGQELPEGWEVKRLQALMSNQIGGGWGKDVADEEHSEAAYVIRGADIPEMRISDNEEVPFRYHTPSNLRSRRLIPGDIIFEVSGGTKDRPVGRTLHMTEEMLSAFDSDVICASFCKRITPDEDAFGAELLYLSLREGYDSGEIEQYQVQSTGLSNFKWTEYIEQTTRLVPPPELRDRFKALVKPMFSQMTILGLQAMNLRRTRDLLLPRLMSGRGEVEPA